MIKKCPACNSVNPTLSTFCASCGAALVSSPSPVPVVRTKRSFAIPVLTGLGTGLVMASIVLIVALTGGSKPVPTVVVVNPPVTTPSLTTPPFTAGITTAAPAITANTTLAATTLAITTQSDDQRKMLTLEAQNRTLQAQQSAQALTVTAQSQSQAQMLTATAQAQALTATAQAIPTPTLPPTAAPPPQTTSMIDRIAFAAPDSNNHWNIYSVKLDGSDLTLLINRSDDVISPAFSPDGQWLAYVLDKSSDQRQIHRVRVNGSDDQALTSANQRSEYPAWSSDSSQIYFISNRNYGAGSTVTDDFVMNSDGSNPQMIIKNGGVISQNNSLISFTRFNGRTHDLMAITGSGEQVLVGDAECDFGVISPDGSQIAYTRGWSDSRTVYLFGHNGNQRRISGPGEIATNPTWSPDSRYVAYLVRGSSEKTWEINMADVTTGQSWRVYTTGALKFYLAWGR